MRAAEPLLIVDAHVHLYDSRENRYEHLERVDAMFEALIGDYATLPRRYCVRRPSHVPGIPRVPQVP